VGERKENKMAIREIGMETRCPSCKDGNTFIQVDTETEKVVINNVEQGGEWIDRGDGIQTFYGNCGAIDSDNKECPQIIKINWYSNGEMIASYIPMSRRKYTGHSFSGEMASSENLGGNDLIYLATEIDGGKVEEGETWVENMTGVIQMKKIIPPEEFGRVKTVSDMGAYMTSALEPLNGAVAIIGARLLLEPVMEDLVGICDIKCESNPTGGNDDSNDYRIYKRLEAVAKELKELSAEFVRINNEENYEE